jgi:hypothetical protein
MSSSPSLFSIARTSACLLLVAVAAPLGIAHAQSEVVFMTADISPGIDSRLIRFDNGIQTFAVDSGEADAFLGTTVLNGEVLVADFVDESIRRFSPGGSYLGTFGLPAGAPSFLESDSSGNVYTTLFSFLPGDPQIALRLNSSGVVTGTFAATKGIDADAAGNVYAVSGSSLVKYAPNGTVINSIGVSNQSWDLAIDEAGSRLFLANQSNLVRIYDISTAMPTFLGNLTTPIGSNIVGVHFAAESGNVLATELGVLSLDPRTLEYSPAGVLLGQYRPTNAIQAWDAVTLGAPIPEPASVTFLLAGAFGLMLLRDRRTHAVRMA